jgi:hypothetical protein
MRLVPLFVSILLVACGGASDPGGDAGMGDRDLSAGGRGVRTDLGVAGSTTGSTTGGSATSGGTTGSSGTPMGQDLGPAPCSSFTDCTSCQAGGLCFFCGDYSGSCQPLDFDHYISCTDVVQCGGSSGGTGSTSGGTTGGGHPCDANGTYVGVGGESYCCSMTVDDSGYCTKAPSGPGVCQRDSDCGPNEWCSFSSGQPVGTCTPKTPGCLESCFSTSDCGTINGLPQVCSQGCCGYAGG